MPTDKIFRRMPLTLIRVRFANGPAAEMSPRAQLEDLPRDVTVKFHRHSLKLAARKDALIAGSTYFHEHFEEVIFPPSNPKLYEKPHQLADRPHSTQQQPQSLRPKLSCQGRLLDQRPRRSLSLASRAKGSKTTLCSRISPRYYSSLRRSVSPLSKSSSRASSRRS